MTRAHLSPFEAITAILRTRLRGEPVSGRLKDRIAQSTQKDIDWVRTASRHRVGPALGACLRDLELQDAFPSDLSGYFEAMRIGNKQQNIDFLDELAEITEMLNAHGVEPCLLKGAAALATDLFPDRSWRFMNDIDLLLPRDQLDFAWNELCALGYEVYDGVIEGKEHHHHRPLWHREGRAYIELHHEIARPRYSRILPGEALLARSHILDHPEIGRVRIPHIEDLAVMLIAHVQIFDSYDRYGAFRLIDLVELDVLTTRHMVDVSAVTDRFHRHGWSRPCLTMLNLADRLLATPATRSQAITPRASFSARRLIWLQKCRPALVVNILCGWMLRTAQRLLFDGDWRWIKPRLQQGVSGPKRAPFFSLWRAIRDLA